MSNGSRCTGFMGLPVEIRTEIYKLALPSKPEGGQCWLAPDQRLLSCTCHTQLLRSSKQVRSEVLPIHYGTHWIYMLLSFHFNSGTETAITSWVDKINDDTIAHLGTLRLDTKIWTTGAFHPVHGAFVVRLCGRKQRPGREPDVLVDWPPGYGKIAGPKVLSVVEALPLRSDGSRVLNRAALLQILHIVQQFQRDYMRR